MPSPVLIKWDDPDRSPGVVPSGCAWWWPALSQDSLDRRPCQRQRFVPNLANGLKDWYLAWLEGSEATFDARPSSASQPRQAPAWTGSASTSVSPLVRGAQQPFGGGTVTTT